MSGWVRAKGCMANECIEVMRDAAGIVYLRIAQTPTVVEAWAEEWEAFVAGVKAGDFDNLETQ